MTEALKQIAERVLGWEKLTPHLQNSLDSTSWIVLEY